MSARGRRSRSTGGRNVDHLKKSRRSAVKQSEQSTRGQNKILEKPQEPYRCARCGLAFDKSWEHTKELSSIPKPRPDKAREWFQCPNDGPLVGVFWDGPNGTQVRNRVALAVEGGEIRACSRRWRETYKDRSGRRKVRTVDAYSGADLRDRWYMMKVLMEHGPYERVEIANLPSQVRDNSHVGRGVFQNQEGTWLLRPVGFGAFTHWEIGVRQWCGGHQVSVEQIQDAVSALNPHYGSSQQWIQDTLKATLFVPLDMRFSLDNQLERILPEVEAIQDNVLEMSGRLEVIPEGDTDVAWRNIFIYLLREIDGVSIADVAKRIFAEERQKKAQSKVRTILSRLPADVREILRRATHDAQHLRCARISDALEDK